jgi:hypothetical protein
MAFVVSRRVFGVIAPGLMQKNSPIQTGQDDFGVVHCAPGHPQKCAPSRRKIFLCGGSNKRPLAHGISTFSHQKKCPLALAEYAQGATLLIVTPVASAHPRLSGREDRVGKRG